MWKSDSSFMIYIFGLSEGGNISFRKRLVLLALFYWLLYWLLAPALEIHEMLVVKHAREFERWAYDTRAFSYLYSSLIQDRPQQPAHQTINICWLLYRRFRSELLCSRLRSMSYAISHSLHGIHVSCLSWTVYVRE